MKVLVFVQHPAHVHLFKNMIWNLQQHGHIVEILAREKEVAFYLLDKYGFQYTPIGKTHSSVIGKAYELVSIDYKCYKLAKKSNPDIIVGTGVYPAHTSKLIGKPSMIFTDTEHGDLGNRLTYPFADVICTPSCFKKDLGKKQIRYNGYHELAYLHPNYFKPDPSVLDELGLKKDDKFVIVRFVAWQAIHDIGQRGFDKTTKLRLVTELEKYARVFITSESPLPEEFKNHRLTIPPEKIHDLLYYATMYVGEGATMASEAAILGIPSIYVSSFWDSMGNFNELEEQYGLIYNFKEPEPAIQKVIELLQQQDLKQEWAKKRERLLKNKIDVTQFMVDLIENYPESLKISGGKS